MILDKTSAEGNSLVLLKKQTEQNKIACRNKSPLPTSGAEDIPKNIYLKKHKPSLNCTNTKNTGNTYIGKAIIKDKMPSKRKSLRIAKSTY